MVGDLTQVQPHRCGSNLGDSQSGADWLRGGLCGSGPARLDRSRPMGHQIKAATTDRRVPTWA